MREATAPERSKATCPAGTVSNTHGMINVLIKYYCEIGSNRSTEHLCPAGSYCPAGSPAPTPCPAVTLSNTQGMINVRPRVHFVILGNTVTIQVVGNLYVTTLHTHAPIGLHCPLGTGTLAPCLPRYYTNLAQQDSCLICSPGFYCFPEEVVIHRRVTLSARRVSTAPRHMVETGPGALKAPFPMFSGLTTSDCQQCLGGKHCDVTNLTAPRGRL
ncbi:hypothetical protein MAR_011900 [Mya arenaria]|uniref:Uncharacterized protein n=1 Tax=Mya arenaria TaxID=6604 RepID=A0ABY7FZL6_MYAAR|nr:hypothetical protein MAR_011900 [Mya arenaria]